MEISALWWAGIYLFSSIMGVIVATIVVYFQTKETAEETRKMEKAINNRIRELRSRGITKLYCGKGCEYELPDPDTEKC